MGNIVNAVKVFRSPVVVTVWTGERPKSGTDCVIRLKLYDQAGTALPEVELDNFLLDDFERGNEDEFGIPADFPEFLGIRIQIHDKRTSKFYEFPILRWIQPDVTWNVSLYDTSLPVADKNPEQRAKELAEKKELYKLTVKVEGMPVQIDTLTEDEFFDDKAKAASAWTKVGVFGEKAAMKVMAKDRWEDLHQLAAVYRTIGLDAPKSLTNWKTDEHFAAQRLSSCSSNLLAQCASGIPANFPVTEDMVKPLLDGETLEDIKTQNRLFIVDLKILEDIKCPDDRPLCAPMALFFLNKSKVLMPLAIQLYQKEGDDNPIFLPTDDPYVWLLAKMWFNNADCAYHQALSNICFTHLAMESVALCTNRNISPSHPIYKLLAPHIHNLPIVNGLTRSKLMAAGGWIDKTMTIGREGAQQLIIKAWKEWRIDADGILMNSLTFKGVESESVLPDYHYRDDAVLIFDLIKVYVEEIVNHYYKTDDAVVADHELQAWGAELAAPHADGAGCGIQGVPGDGKFEKKSDLVQLLNTIVYICSAGYAAANYAQYETYAFPPNYPTILNGKPPSDKKALTERAIVDAIPSIEQSLDVMVVTQLLSKRVSKALGDFDVLYIYEPEALKIVQKFKDGLKKVSVALKERNAKRARPHVILDPVDIPNYINL
ncbi:allene oxide synthase-lipoxygenase protein-like [Tubulanus polymorphus]|uniref:allene oxide synthase-lipoxygenase protein-like n=1 Tax=Tubulanus polymorphus TaxID=672921 RepID=UPI003DA2C79A